MTDTDGLLKDAGGARPASDVDALIERLEKDAIAWGLVFDSTVSASTTAALEREAAAALVQLREENARLGNDYNVARESHDRRAQELAKVRAENSGLVQTVRDAADHLRRAEAERNEWKCEALVRRERIADLERERDALREMVTLATSVHTMTDEQLDELRANAQATIDAAKEKPNG